MQLATSLLNILFCYKTNLSKYLFKGNFRDNLYSAKG